MLRCALTLAALCSIHASQPVSIAVAQQAATSSSPDPIVGVWALDTISGENIEYVITVYPDGTTKNRVVGQEFAGTWKRLQNGHYLMDPGGEDDYVVLRNGRLEEWDKTGFIRSLKRISAGKTSSRPIRHGADSARRPAAAQQWYAGGTLHNKTALDWQVAESHDKIATCGDFIAKAWEGGSFKAEIQEEIHGIHDMRPYAVKLVAFLDAATKKEGSKKRNTQMYANQTVAELAAIGMAMMGWLE